MTWCRGLEAHLSQSLPVPTTTASSMPSETLTKCLQTKSVPKPLLCLAAMLLLKEPPVSGTMGTPRATRIQRLHRGLAPALSSPSLAPSAKDGKVLAEQGQSTHHTVRPGEAQQPPTPSPQGEPPARKGSRADTPPCCNPPSLCLPQQDQWDMELVLLGETHNSGQGQGRPGLGDQPTESKTQSDEAGLWHGARLCPGRPGAGRVISPAQMGSMR